MTIMALVLCVIALMLGAIVGWVVGSARRGAEAQRALAERDAARAEREKSDALRAEMQRRVENALQDRAGAEARVIETEKLLANHKQLEDTFAVLAQKAFKDVSESLVQANTTQVGGTLDGVLVPVKEMLDAYRAEVLKSEHARNESYGGLQEQLRALLSTQASAQREAARLASALQSPTVQGSWGEMSLKRCIELAGMSEHAGDFETQQTFMTDEGRRIRPDMIVHLPNERVIAIDAKASITEYIAACSETDETRKRALLEQHAKNLRRHVDALSRRDYQASVGETLDFTVMYVPGEHFLSAALVTDTTLFEYAAEKRVVLGSPTVLIPLLRAIAAGWKVVRTEENAKKMHDAAVELFNRFVTVMDHVTGVGDQLRKTVDTYNKAIRSIDTRLYPKGEELQRMAGSGKGLEEPKQIEAVPLESAKLRLTMQNEEPGIVIPMRE